MGVPPRCPFATVESCPRFYQSLSLLGSAGSTAIESSEDKRLLEKWEKSDLWPKTMEQETIIYGNSKFFDKFCPEVAFERFGYFVSHLGRYSDEIDHDLAHEKLGKIGAPSEDYRWAWSSVTSMHYTECPLYSVLFYRHNGIDEKRDQKALAYDSERHTVDIQTSPDRSIWKQRWKKLSSKAKVFVISLTTFVALLAAFLTNIDKIQNYLNSKKPSPSVSSIVVKLLNSSEDGVIINARGDFTLWLPSPEAKHTMGKYEFLTIEGKSLTGNSFVIPPNDKVTVYAKIMNEAYFSKILSQSDCDLSLIVYRADAGLTHTNTIPFTNAAIKKYYVEADVGK